MKSNEKKLILILIIILVIAIIIFNVNKKGAKKDLQAENENNTEEFVTVLADGTKLNRSDELQKTKTLGNLKFEKMQLTNKNGQTVLLAEVTNTGSVNTQMTLVTVSILDKSGNELGKADGMIIPLEAGQKTQFNVTTMTDYANAYDFTITKK